VGDACCDGCLILVLRLLGPARAWPSRGFPSLNNAGLVHTGRGPLREDPAPVLSPLASLAELAGHEPVPYLPSDSPGRARGPAPWSFLTTLRLERRPAFSREASWPVEGGRGRAVGYRSRSSFHAAAFALRYGHEPVPEFRAAAGPIRTRMSALAASRARRPRTRANAIPGDPSESVAWLASPPPSGPSFLIADNRLPLTPLIAHPGVQGLRISVSCVFQLVLEWCPIVQIWLGLFVESDK